MTSETRDRAAIGVPDTSTTRRDTVKSRPTRNRRAGRFFRLGAQVGILVLAILIWWYASVTLPVNVMPSPFETIVTLGQLSATPGFWQAVGVTVATFALGLVICTVVGVPLGLAIGASRIATQSTRLVFDFLRTIPPIAILPLVLLLFGPSAQMVLVVVILGAIWPILVQSIYAARQGEPLLIDMSRSFRIPRAHYVFRIFLPGTLPFVMTGLRVGTTICLLLTITAELLSGAPGVGSEIQNAENYLNTPAMYAYVLVAAILGLIVNVAFWMLQRRVLSWHASNRKEA